MRAMPTVDRSRVTSRWRQGDAGLRAERDQSRPSTIRLTAERGDADPLLGRDPLQDPPGHRGGGRRPQAGLLHHDGDDVTGRVGRRVGREQRGVELADDLGRPRLARHRELGEREAGEGAEAGADRIGDHALEPRHQRLEDRRRQLGAAEHLGLDLPQHLAVPVEHGVAELGREHRAAVHEGGVGVGQLEGRDLGVALADGHVQVVAGVPLRVREGGGVLLVELLPARRLVDPPVGLEREVDVGVVAHAEGPGHVLDGGGAEPAPAVPEALPEPVVEDVAGHGERLGDVDEAVAGPTGVAEGLRALAHDGVAARGRCRCPGPR